MDSLPAPTVAGMRRWLPVVFVVMAACAADPIERGAEPTGGVTTIALTTVATTGVATASTTTIPEPAPWAIVVVGDFGTGDAAEAQVAGAIADWVRRRPPAPPRLPGRRPPPPAPPGTPAAAPQP